MSCLSRYFGCQATRFIRMSDRTHIEMGNMRYPWSSLHHLLPALPPVLVVSQMEDKTSQNTSWAPECSFSCLLIIYLPLPYHQQLLYHRRRILRLQMPGRTRLRIGMSKLNFCHILLLHQQPSLLLNHYSSTVSLATVLLVPQFKEA